ncbi:MAG: NAD(P)H-dependent oxidoreductase subunit E [Deltaproteobacteria bacterium]|nr:NAD(P)H-dependent oxidoreductase subunit E [Deltaproteobacteria bacterium]
MDVERLESILSRYEGYPQDLIPILQEIQDQYHYLPKDELKECLGTTCHLKGGQRLLESMTSHLGIEPGYTTPDMQFSLETVGCLGSCAQAPVMMVDDKYYARMTIDKVPKILKLYKE